MRITKQQLEQIIKEELSAIFEERGPWFDATLKPMRDIAASYYESAEEELNQDIDGDGYIGKPRARGPEEYKADLSSDDEAALEAALEADREKQDNDEWNEFMALVGARYAIK